MILFYKTRSIYAKVVIELLVTEMDVCKKAGL